MIFQEISFVLKKMILLIRLYPPSYHICLDGTDIFLGIYQWRTVARDQNSIKFVISMKKSYF